MFKPPTEGNSKVIRKTGFPSTKPQYEVREGKSSTLFFLHPEHHLKGGGCIEIGKTEHHHHKNCCEECCTAKCCSIM